MINALIKIKNQKGQALVTLLFFVVIGMTIITAAAISLNGNIQSTSISEQGTYAYYIAESGVEEGLLQLIRNPNYTGTTPGQPIIIGEGNVVVQVSGNLITATGTYRNTIRKIQVQTMYNNNVLTIASWKEI